MSSIPGLVCRPVGIVEEMNLEDYKMYYGRQ